MSNQPPNPATQMTFGVDLPAGGKLYLHSPEEVELWENTSHRYIEDYHLTNTNDLLLLGAILQQQILMFRAQFLVNGMIAEIDAAGVPTGRYVQTKASADEMVSAQKLMNTARGEITSMEKVLGIDKATREAGGQMSVSGYLRTLKKAAHERGIRLSKRLVLYEQFVQDLSWRIRVLKNADAEDRAYHNITPESICEWVEGQVKELEDGDKKWAKEVGSLYVGKL
jgi:hypothetical protein